MRTSLYTILCIVIRLGALFLAFGTLTRIPATVMTWRQNAAVTSIGLAAIAIGVVLLIALALWIYPGVIAKLAAGRNSREVFESPLSSGEWQWIAFSVLGVYFAFDALIALAHYVVQWALLSDAVAPSDDDRRQWVSDVSYYVIEGAAGLALALGARGLAATLRRVRYGNAERLAIDEDESGARRVAEASRDAGDRSN